MMPHRFMLTGLIGLMLATGCSDLDNNPQSRSAPSQWGRIALPNTPPDQAFDAAVEAVRQYFPQFDASRVDGRIVTAMVEYSQQGGTGRLLRDGALKENNRMRRRATLLITATADGSAALCEVRVQRLDTADQRAFQQNREFNDLPNATPIERDAGVSGAQSEAWTEMPRDTTMEQRILQSIFNRVGKTRESATTTQKSPA